MSAVIADLMIKRLGDYGIILGMGAPVFKVGDQVRVQRSISRGPGEALLDALGHLDPKGIFEVVRVLPTTHGERQYQIKGGHPSHERVVWERQLVHVRRDDP